MLWMIDNQLGKRNVSIMSRVQLVERGKHLIESRQGANQYTERASAKNLAEAPTHPRDQLAEKAGVSKETYRAAKLILEAEESGEITPEVADAVRTNKIAVHRVAKDIKETRQKGRRNVSDYDKGLLAMRKQELLRPMAKANEKARKGNQPGASLAKLPNLSKIDTRREAAKEAGIGERTLDAVKLIKDAADKGEIAPEVIDDIRHRKIAIHRVAKDIKETRQKAAREEKGMDRVETRETGVILVTN